MTPLAAAVAAAGPDLVRRGRAGFAADPVTLPLRLEAALELGAGRAVAVVADAAGARWTVPLVAVADGVRRAVAGDGVAQALVALLASGEPDRAGFAVRRWHAGPATGERAVAVDQTNESVVVGDRAVVKWALRLPPAGSPAVHPAPGRLAALSAAGFEGTARPWGALELVTGAAPDLLATVTAFLPGAVDGWDWAVDDVRRHARGELPLADAAAPAATVGVLVARMHAALAAAGTGTLAPADAARWAATARADLADVLRRVDGPEGERLAARAPAVAAGLEPLDRAAGTPVIAVHGDLHVGQVLRYPTATGDAYAVVDFDGNPVVPPAERGDARPAAVDVAGMLASLDHVGRVVVRRTDGVDAAAVERWIRLAEQAFLDAYTATLADAGLARLLDRDLLRPLRLHTECREFRYALDHLPHWRYVPDAALGALLDEGNPA